MRVKDGFGLRYWSMPRPTWLRGRTNISAAVFPSFDKGYTRDTYRFSCLLIVFLSNLSVNKGWIWFSYWSKPRLTWLRGRIKISATVFRSFDKGYTRDTYPHLISAQVEKQRPKRENGRKHRRITISGKILLSFLDISFLLNDKHSFPLFHLFREFKHVEVTWTNNLYW